MKLVKATNQQFLECIIMCIHFQFETDGFYWMEDLMSDWQLYKNVSCSLYQSFTLILFMFMPI